MVKKVIFIILDVVRLIGFIILLFLGVEYGFFYYRVFEYDKVNVFVVIVGNFNMLIELFEVLI